MALLGTKTDFGEKRSSLLYSYYFNSTTAWPQGTVASLPHPIWETKCICEGLEFSHSLGGASRPQKDEWAKDPSLPSQFCNPAAKTTRMWCPRKQLLSVMRAQQIAWNLRKGSASRENGGRESRCIHKCISANQHIWS